MPITTEFILPPIPIRDFDWAAYRDPEGHIGRGATEAEAITDFLLAEGFDKVMALITRKENS